MKRTKKKQKQQQQYHQHCFWKTSTITRTRTRDNVENYNLKVQGIRQHSHSKWERLLNELMFRMNEWSRAMRMIIMMNMINSPPFMWKTMTSSWRWYNVVIKLWWWLGQMPSYMNASRSVQLLTCKMFKYAVSFIYRDYCWSFPTYNWLLS